MMTDDLVERLRANDSEIYLPILGEAADHIEALTAEKDRLGNLLLETIDKTADKNAREIVRLEVEIERLRDALEYIVRIDDHNKSCPSGFANVARAALNCALRELEQLEKAT